MEKKRILVDTDILIKLYRGNKEIRKTIKPIESNLCISVITALELLRGVKNSTQFIQMRKTIHAYELLHVNSAVSITAFGLANRYGKKHNIRVADTLIAATAIENKIYLYTDNKKDYDFISELKLYQPGSDS